MYIRTRTATMRRKIAAVTTKMKAFIEWQMNYYSNSIMTLFPNIVQMLRIEANKSKREENHH